jgi:hypothetical protein
VRCVQRALGIEETEETDDRMGLQEELKQELASAEPHALRRALEALKRKA